jgi:hypothetical protein
VLIQLEREMAVDLHRRNVGLNNFR